MQKNSLGDVINKFIKNILIFSTLLTCIHSKIDAIKPEKDYLYWEDVTFIPIPVETIESIPVNNNHNVMYESCVMEYEGRPALIENYYFNQETTDCIYNVTFLEPAISSIDTSTHATTTNSHEITQSNKVNTAPDCDHFKDFTQEQRQQELADKFEIQQKNAIRQSMTQDSQIIKELSIPKGTILYLKDVINRTIDSEIILKNAYAIQDLSHELVNPIIEARFQRIKCEYRNKPIKRGRGAKYNYKSQLKFLDALLSGKVARLIDLIQHPDLKIAESAFNQLKNLWDWKHDHTFLIPSTVNGIEESDFITVLGIDIMKIVERYLITRPDYIAAHTNSQSQAIIQKCKEKCALLQQTNDIKTLFKKVKQPLFQEVVKKGKQATPTDIICLAIAEKAVLDPINVVLGRIKDAPSLKSAGNELENLKRQILQEDLILALDVQQKMIEQYGFDILQAAYDIYRNRSDYVSTPENQSILSNGLEVSLRHIKEQKLPIAHAELINVTTQLIEQLEEQNIADPVAQKECIIKDFDADVLTDIQSTYENRGDLRHLVENFIPIDVPSATIDIINSSKDYEAIANGFDRIAQQVLDNAQLCDLEYLPIVEDQLMQSLQVMRSPRNETEFVFHATVADHLMADLQSHTHAIATGKPITWERSSELLTRGFVKFIVALNPIEQAKDIGSLAADIVCIIPNRIAQIAHDPIGTTQNSIATTISIVNFISDIARFTSDTTTGICYLSSDQGQKRLGSFCKNIADFHSASEKFVEAVTAEQAVDCVAKVAADFVFAHGIFKAAGYLKKIDAIGKISDEAKMVARHLKNAVEEHPAYVTAEGIVLKMSDGLKDVGPKTNNSNIKSVVEDIPKSGGRIMQENGKTFEDFLVKKLGGQGSFKVSNREFDGAIGNIWYEAKSGGYWDMLLSSEDKLGDFKSSMGHHLKIANENGKIFQLHSSTPIPREIKEWLTKKNISYTEWL